MSSPGDKDKRFHIRIELGGWLLIAGLLLGAGYWGGLSDGRKQGTCLYTKGGLSVDELQRGFKKTVSVHKSQLQVCETSKDVVEATNEKVVKRLIAQVASCAGSLAKISRGRWPPSPGLLGSCSLNLLNCAGELARAQDSADACRDSCTKMILGNDWKKRYKYK